MERREDDSLSLLDLLIVSILSLLVRPIAIYKNVQSLFVFEVVSTEVIIVEKNSSLPLLLTY